jgi:hypothetical protein
MSKMKKNDISNSEKEGIDFITNQIKDSLKLLHEEKSRLKSGDTSSLENKKRKFDLNAKQIFIDTNILEEAPDEWNRFKLLSGSEFQILKKSIEDQGLMHPIYIWEYNNRFIIISGHYKVKAFKELYDETIG